MLRIVSLLGFTDASGYYESHPIPMIANLVFGLSLLFIGVAAIFFIKKNESVDIPNKTAGIAALLPIGALAFHAINLFASITEYSADPMKTFFSATGTVHFYVVLFSILSISFFALIAMIAFKRKASTAIAYVGLIPLIYVILLWASTHFDFLITLNSANKTFFFVACASALLFIYNEIAACCKLMLRSKFYYFSLFAAIITLSTASIPSVIAYLSGSLGRYFSLEGDLFFITVLIYATVRLITLIIEQRKAPAIERETETQKNDTAEIAEEASEHLDEKSEEKAE